MAKALILNDLADKLSIKIYKLEEEIGVSRSTISKAIANNSDLSTMIIQKIITKYPNINKDWLYSGEGEIFPHAETTIIPDDEGCLIEVPYIIKDADYAKGFSGHHAPLTETTYMLPVSYIQLRYVVIDVHDNSMRPELIDGDTVLCVDMIPEIWPALWAADLTYCLVTKDGIIYRYIADFDHKTDTFKLVTVNSQAPPEFINMKDVRKLMRVESIVEPSPKRLGRKSTARKLTG